MRFYSEDPRTVDVQWYFVDDDTPFIPYSTPFRSLEWMPDNALGVYNDLGEDYLAERVWVNGENPGNAVGRAGQLCGTADQWRNGQPLPPVVPTPVNAVGTPLCCGSAPVSDCPYYPGPPLQTVAVQYAGQGDGIFACSGIPRGTFALAYTGLCRWESAAFPVTLTGGGLTYDLAKWFLEGTITTAANLVFAFHPVGYPPTTFLMLVGWTVPTWDGRSDTTALGPIDPFGLCAWPTSVPIEGTMPLIGSAVLDTSPTAIPAGYLFANGQAVSRTTYSALFALWGTMYGPGDGSTTFNIPNMQGLFARGLSGSFPLGSTGGSDSVTLGVAELPAHNHALTDPGHTHPPVQGSFLEILAALPTGHYSASGTAFLALTGTNAATDVATDVSGIGFSATDNTGSGNPVTTTPPYFVGRWLIYAGV